MPCSGQIWSAQNVGGKKKKKLRVWLHLKPGLLETGLCTLKDTTWGHINTTALIKYFLNLLNLSTILIQWSPSYKATPYALKIDEVLISAACKKKKERKIHFFFFSLLDKFKVGSPAIQY